MPSLPKHNWSKLQTKFLECYKGNQTQAARDAGYSNPRLGACRCMKVPAIREACENKLKMVQEAAAKEEGKALGKKAAISKSQVMDRLWDLASLSPKETNGNVNGQVRAAIGLSEILGMKIGPQSADKFDGFTDEELEKFAADGTVPERFASRFGITSGSTHKIM